MAKVRPKITKNEAGVLADILREEKERAVGVTDREYWQKMIDKLEKMAACKR